MIILFLLFFIPYMALANHTIEELSPLEFEEYKLKNGDCAKIANRYYMWFLYSCARLNLSKYDELLCIKSIDRQLNKLVEYCKNQYNEGVKNGR